jgi:serine/threonine protein phosphatase 1
MDDPVYAVGDIHGQLEQLEEALRRIEADGGPDARVVFLGDYVDRGPESAGTLARLRAGLAEGRPWHCLLGNHDLMFLRFVREGQQHDRRILSGNGWLTPPLGGRATLASYGVDPAPGRPLEEIAAEAARRVPEADLAFVESLPRRLDTPARLFVHAGVRPGVPLDRQDPEDLVWIRDGFLEHPAPWPKLVVHGHTALPEPAHFGPRVDLDGGAGYGRELFPAVFEGERVWLLNARGRRRLLPPG